VHEVRHQDRRDDAHDERDHREVVALEAQRRHADDEAGHGCGGHGGHEADHERRARLHEQRRGVRADPHERGVAERYEAGSTDEQVQAGDEDDVDRDHHEQVLGCQTGEQVRGCYRSGEAQEDGQLPHSLASCSPNSPRGRTSSTMTMSTNAVSSAYWTLSRPPVRFSARPTISAPRIAPGTLPMPPKMTIANAFMTTMAAMLGSNAFTADARVPAAPANAPASRNAVSSTRNGSR